MISMGAGYYYSFKNHSKHFIINVSRTATTEKLVCDLNTSQMQKRNTEKKLKKELRNVVKDNEKSIADNQSS